MRIQISEEVELDLLDGYRFYEDQSPGLGDYFRECLMVDIDSLRYFAGIHEHVFGYQRSLSKRFPFAIYYSREAMVVRVVAIVDCRRDPAWIRNRLT